MGDAFKAKLKAKPIPTPKKVYSDAKKVQFIICKRRLDMSVGFRAVNITYCFLGGRRPPISLVMERPANTVLLDPG